MLRVFGLGAFMIAIAIGIYLYAKNAQSIAQSSPGGTLTSQPEIVGVRADLLSIANAERTAMAGQGAYLSLDDLISGHYVNIKGSRPPYTYAVETSESGFRVVATRSTPGRPGQIWIDETMKIQSSE
jgi:hypothetical protein